METLYSILHKIMDLTHFYDYIFLIILFIIFFFVSGSSILAEANENIHTIRYTVPEIDFASITPEEEMLIEIGWNLDADIPYWNDIIDFSEFTHSNRLTKGIISFRISLHEEARL